MKKQKWYTLVELVIVIIILGILIGASVWRLSRVDMDRYHAEVCINHIYGEISNFFHAANASKILTGETSHKNYQMLVQDQKISLKYLDDQNNNQEYSDILLSKQTECKSERYEVRIDKDLEIILLPNLKSIGNTKGFSITQNWSALFTGEVKFDMKMWVNNHDFMKILFDARTGIIKKSFCKYYQTDHDKAHLCKQRSSTI